MQDRRLAYKELELLAHRYFGASGIDANAKLASAKMGRNFCLPIGLKVDDLSRLASLRPGDFDTSRFECNRVKNMRFSFVRLITI